MNIAVCGEDYNTCKHLLANGVSCHESAGGVKMSSNQCEMYHCVSERQLLHCGFCDDFPCQWFEDMTGKSNSENAKKLTQVMEKQSVVQSRCGLMCKDCEWKDSHGCGGCIETKGHPFHGECGIAICCQEKGLIHCGECADMPCEQLYEYSCLDKEHGDKPSGARLNVLRKWARLKNGKVKL